MDSGVDSPEGSVTASAGCQYLQYDLHLGGDTAKFWIKTPGQDDTPYGWAVWFDWNPV